MFNALPSRNTGYTGIEEQTTKRVRDRKCLAKIARSLRYRKTSDLMVGTSLIRWYCRINKRFIFYMDFKYNRNLSFKIFMSMAVNLAQFLVSESKVTPKAEG